MSNMLRDRIRITSFEPFILTLLTVAGHDDLNSLYALMERWIDTTNTFHLPIGELTLDSLAFAAITGIACAGAPVPFDRYLELMTTRYVAYIDHLLGMTPAMKGTHTIKLDSLFTHYSGIRVEDIRTPRQIDQVVRAFILYLLGTTLFYNAASSMDLVVLMALRDVDLIHTYDWGSAALAYLYWGMDEFV